MDYLRFLQRKVAASPPTGIAHKVSIPDGLFPHQQVLVEWAIRRGRCAIFADTGLGKSRMQLAWADAVHRESGHDVLILAPLAVAAQTVREGREIDVHVKQCRDGADVVPGITITNYDRLHRFDCSRFGAVVLDESSIIKHHDAKTLRILLEAFAHTPFKLCATATPAPNDWTELGTHAEFLGICSRVEMLAEYFVHDGGDTQKWRLKGHAREVFWRWVSSWAALLRKPSELGFDDDRYNLPPLKVHQHISKVDHATAAKDGMLFALEASTLSERRAARRASMADRIDACASLVKDEWAKLAAGNDWRITHGLETGAREGEAREREGRSGVRGEAKGAVGERSGCEEGIHAPVLQSESGQIQAHAGTERCEERGKAGQVRSRRGVSQEDESASQGVAEGQSRQAKESEAESSRDRPERFRGHDGDAGRGVCDLWAHGRVESELLSASRSLSQDGGCSRALVHELQSGAGEVCGRPNKADACGGVHREAWLIWCDLNDEQDSLERHFGDLAFSVRGSMTPDEKEAAILGWLAGERPVMISKPSIMGWGINAQHCSRMAFVGVTDSFEAYYQAVRRCWRFGQRQHVNVHVFTSELEGAVVANLRRKEQDAAALADALSEETAGAVRDQVLGVTRDTNPYEPRTTISAPEWLITEEQ